MVPLRPDIASASAEVADEDAFAATLLGLYVRHLARLCLSTPLPRNKPEVDPNPGFRG